MSAISRIFLFILQKKFFFKLFPLFIVTRPWRLLAIDSLPSVRRSGKSMPIGMNLSCLLADWVNFPPWGNSKWKNTECKRSWLIANVLLQDLWLNLNQHLLWRDIVLDLLAELSGMYIFCLIHFLSVYLVYLHIFLFSVWLLALYHGIITMWNWNRVLNIWNVTLVMIIPLSSIVLRLEKEKDISMSAVFLTCSNL